MSDLARTYRILMLAYPRWHRRERGLELLTTLLDDAAPGQRRPRLVDAANVLRAGLLTRLRPPRTPIAWLITVVVTAAAGLAAAAAAVLLSPYPGPPAEDEAIAAAAVAVGPVTDNVPGPPVHCPLGGCHVYGITDQVVPQDAEPMRIDNTVVYYRIQVHEAFNVMSSVRGRLVAAGWRVDPAPPPSDIAGLTAYNGTLRVHVSGFDLGLQGTAFSSVTVYVAKQVSATTIVSVFAAGVGGLMAGWPLGVWALQRFRRHQAGRRRAILIATIPFLLTAPLVLVATGVLVASDLSNGIDPADIQAPLAFAGLSPQATYFSALSVLSGLIGLGLTAPVRGTSAGGSTYPARQTPA
jgi:hypothetical protein